MKASIIGYAVGYAAVPILIMFPTICFSMRHKVAIAKNKLTKSFLATWGATALSPLLIHNIFFSLAIAGFASFYFIHFFSERLEKTPILDN